MDQQNPPHNQIITGAVVEATDGFVGIVQEIITDPQTGQIIQLVIQNESESKQFTIPIDLVARQVGTRLIHLNIPRDQLVNRSDDTEFDSETGNMGSHNAASPSHMPPAVP
jgi:sporulation protein YlmC with PRC-barrel domain